MSSESPASGLPHKIRALKPSTSIRQAVLDLWAALTGVEQQRCQRMYVEAAALDESDTDIARAVTDLAEAIEFLATR
ncbi:MAG: hypothetical protein H7288_16830 [Kineosporiaceae bacterium]|nr:hypothetical protein [Aeromicrobium sp.]